MSEEAPRDEVAVFDTSERKGDVDRSSDEESELRDIMGPGWYKREKGTQDGGEGNRGAKNCRMSGVSGGLGWRGGGRGRKWVGLGKEAGSRACL